VNDKPDLHYPWYVVLVLTVIYMLSFVESRRVGDFGNGSLPVAIRLAQQFPRLLPAAEAVMP
jgi:hypothetical protein